MAVAPVVAQAAEPASDPTVFHRSEALTLRWHLQAGINAVAEQNLFWRLADTTAPGSGFDADTEWLEFYAKPGVSGEAMLGGGRTLYGRLSAVGSYTAGTDAFDRGDTGAATLEEAHLGLRGTTAGGIGYDLAIGPQELKLGTGMLVASGASSGFERGALKFGPRKAWSRAAVARLSQGGFTGTAFYLGPNELPSSDGGNRLAGVDLRRDDGEGGHLGATLLRVQRSGSPYVQAAPGGAGAPTILPGARAGTRTLDLYARTSPSTGLLAGWTLAAELALQRNGAIDLKAWAGRLQVSRALAGVRWAPTLSYSYQTFSGDDPATAALERFDPLYYEGSPSAWSTGSKSSMAFINSNVQAHALALRVQPTPRDTLTLRYAHVRANELRSPIQFGQATRLDTSGSDANLVAGVTRPHLSDDVFLEYSRVVNRHTYLSAGVAVAMAGAGIRDAAGGRAPDWRGAFVNVVINH
ncbi:alginate export family protein [Rubrivivax albus]|uniref:Alginate export domain-containing protein n=1 Tax=Rubrivivax albus TaxID=2499835 RepID=A0A3S2TPX0_9BURK|nr:alginate export family protein [Rubrivivax albus]RVT53997.1 hypothetical protein ENE75_03730 [Rubrivivax albus]